MSKSTRFMFAAITGIVIASAASPAFAQSDGNSGRQMMGGGMMGQQSTGPGAMGPGMMGPGAMGPGMMGPGMMGPGMMGPGMMGPGMMGPGMMGPGMMGPNMMGAMMSSGTRITLPELPAGNDALQFRMHAEMMQKIGEIAVRYADHIETGK